MLDNLKSCNQWLVNNKLSLHVGKTECILFGTRFKLNKASDFQVTYQNHVIKPQTHIKYLGVLLDNTLSGERFIFLQQHLTSTLSLQYYIPDSKLVLQARVNNFYTVRCDYCCVYILYRPLFR